MQPSLERYLYEPIRKDALTDHKMAFISGPRQVGKSTLARSLLKIPGNEYSWDDESFRRAWVRSPIGAIENRGLGPILLDEIHKDRKWKRRLKGLYDLKGREVSILVTGSARLDVFQKGGDSMSGRYIPYRLHPFTVGESASPLKLQDPQEILKYIGDHKPRYPWEDLIKLGGFPEPLHKGSDTWAQRWSRLRMDRVVQEDVRDLLAVSDLQAMRVLSDLLPGKVGGLLSLNSLREDVGVAYATLRTWTQTLLALHFGFTITPFAGRLKRTLRAEPKLYLFDLLRLPAKSIGARRENLAALHLYKSCQFWTDLGYGEYHLHFLRDKEKREVDFLIIRDGAPWVVIECKSGLKTQAPYLRYFSEKLKIPFRFQLVSDVGYDRTFPESKIRVISYERFFAAWI